MGNDKSLLVYHGKPQRYHVYEMLSPICEKVFMSCNNNQVNSIGKEFESLADLSYYENIGPMAALLTAFYQYPGEDLLVIGCDYPFLTREDIKDFSDSFDEGNIAAAFYNEKQELYEPMLAWYSAASAEILLKMHEHNNHSLQYFLERNDASKYLPENTRIIWSIDNFPDYTKAINIISKENPQRNGNLVG